MKIDYFPIGKKELYILEERFNIVIPSCQDNNRITPIGAYFKNEIVGCILLQTANFKDFIANYFIVLPVFRDMGVGSTLLEYAVEFCKTNLAEKITLKSNSFDHDIAKLNSFFKKNNWDILNYEYTKYKFRIKDFKELFIKKYYIDSNSSNIDDHIIYHFSQLSKEQIDYINTKAHLIEGLDLFPIYGLKYIVPELSFFVMVNDEFVAWSVSAYENDNEITIRHTYVDEKFRSTGLGLHLWNLTYRQLLKNSKFKGFQFASFCFQKNIPKLLKLYMLLFNQYLYGNTDYFCSTKRFTV